MTVFKTTNINKSHYSKAYVNMYGVKYTHSVSRTHTRTRTHAQCASHSVRTHLIISVITIYRLLILTYIPSINSTIPYVDVHVYIYILYTIQ